ncbi:TPA: serine/threonine-protein kinase [Serratia marcescens]
MSITKRYVPTTTHAAGGFGEVVVCNDLHLERLVAVKRLKETSEKKRMEDEVNALLALRSKHVVQLYDIVKDENDKLCVVEEYIDGPDLGEYAGKIKNSKELMVILWQIASGIADIHDFKIIHRDIKPNNIKIDSEGIVKIYDFGLSRSRDDAATIGFVGTPIFAAPELFIGTPSVTFSNAVDTYAFAVTSMCLAGVPLPPELKTITKILKNNPFDAAKFPLPEKIKELLFLCLNVNPEKRPDMRSVRHAFQQHIQQGTHKAFIMHKGNQHTLDRNNRGVTLRQAGVGEVEIVYDGFDFYISRMSGEVTVNNMQPKINSKFPHSCVIIIGGIHRNNRERSFITFDISHPEVLL